MLCLLNQRIRNVVVCVVSIQKFKLSHSYHITPGSEEERDFPIAYNILMHKDLHQVTYTHFMGDNLILSWPSHE